MRLYAMATAATLLAILAGLPALGAAEMQQEPTATPTIPLINDNTRPPKATPTPEPATPEPSATATKDACPSPRLTAELCEFVEIYETQGKEAAWQFGAQIGLILSDCCVMVMTTHTDLAAAEAFIAAGRSGSDGHYAHLHSRYDRWVDVWVCVEAISYWVSYPGLEVMQPSAAAQPAG